MEQEIEVVFENTEMNIDVTNDALEIGIVPQGAINIVENGSYDVTNYETANVDTPGIVPSGTLEIQENGTYDITEYETADVNVPPPEPVLQNKSLTITENTTTIVIPDTDYVGLRSVEIDTNISGDPFEFFTETIGGGAMYTTIIKKIPAIRNTGTSCNNMFNGCKAEEIDLSNFDTTNVTDMQRMFMGCGNLKSLDMSHLNTGNVTSFYAMFDSCTALTSLNANFDVSKASTVQSMFGGCSSLTSLDLSAWEFRAANCQAGMLFWGCASLQHLDLRSATMSRTYGSGMFTNVPNDCEIIVKDAAQKTWFANNWSNFTNVKTVEEYEGE